jgi:hypothetical protein
MRDAADGTPGMLTTESGLSGLFFLWMLAGVIGEIIRDWGFVCDPGISSGDAETSCDHVAKIVEPPREPHVRS